MEDENSTPIEESVSEQKTKNSRRKRLPKKYRNANSEASSGAEIHVNSNQKLDHVMDENKIENKPLKKNRHKSHKNIGNRNNSEQSDDQEKIAVNMVEKSPRKRNRRPKQHRNATAAQINSCEIENSTVTAVVNSGVAEDVVTKDQNKTVCV